MQAKWKVLAVTAVMGLSFGAAGCVVHDHGRSWRGGYGYYDGHRTGYGHRDWRR